MYNAVVTSQVNIVTFKIHDNIVVNNNNSHCLSVLDLKLAKLGLVAIFCYYIVNT